MIKKKRLEIVAQGTYMHYILFISISMFWFSNDNKRSKNYQ